MSLVKLANRLKRIARARGSATEKFEQGALVDLKCAQGKFQMAITRPIKSQRADRFERWEGEVRTFMRDIGITKENLISVEYPNTLVSYQAVILWWDNEGGLREAHHMPQNATEIAAWAQTLGLGVKIRGVNVFTGEM